MALSVADSTTLRLTVQFETGSNSNHTLSDMLPPILDHAAIAANNILYYEVLGIIPLAELERLTLLVTGLPRPPLPSLS